MLHTVVTASNQCYRSKTAPIILQIRGTNGHLIEAARIQDAETGDFITVGPIKAICNPLRQ